jgi:hypothetical protein
MPSFTTRPLLPPGRRRASLQQRHRQSARRALGFVREPGAPGAGGQGVPATCPSGGAAADSHGHSRKIKLVVAGHGIGSSGMSSATDFPS